MEIKDYVRCVELIVNEEDYAMLYNYLLKHTDEPVVKKWIDQECKPFIQNFSKIRSSTEKEKAWGLGDYIRKPI